MWTLLPLAAGLAVPLSPVGMGGVAQDPDGGQGEVRPIEVVLEPRVPGDGRGPRWSPKAEAVDLTDVGGLLVGEFALGPEGSPPVLVMLGRSEESGRVERLAIDQNRNGAFDEDETFTATPREQRGKWWSSFDATLAVDFIGADGAVARQPYPMALWFVEDPAEPDAAPRLRWSRRGWYEGTFEVDGRPAYVLVSELRQDGRIDQRDVWVLAREREALYAPGTRSLGDHAWLDGRAYRAVSIGADGRSLDLVPHDPGMTEAEERERADHLRKDREAPRAAAPLAFGADFDAALAAARLAGKRVFVDFETTWCGPCKQMDQFVYTAAAVVAAAESVVAVKLDGDVERELVRRYDVKAYPTLLLLDADGKELRRAVGYTSVADTVRFLAP